MYSVVAGDTFELVARKEYGTEVESGRIASANPGVLEPLIPGTVLVIPVNPEYPVDVQSKQPTAGVNEVAVLIDGVRFRFWDNIRITRSIDAMDQIEFEAPFEPDAPGFRATFRPLSYKKLTVSVGGEPLFTGTMVDVTPPVTVEAQTVSVSGYSIPGVLNDCMAPASAYPLEFNGVGLQEVATKLAEPFGVSVVFEADQGALLNRVAMAPTKKVISFLIDLAKQRNLIISSSPRGALVFRQSASTGSPVARLRQGESPLVSVEPSFQPQNYYSHTSGIEPTTVGLPGASFTVPNPRLPGVVRPFVFITSDTAAADVKAAVEAKAGRIFANAVTYFAALSTWRDPAGELWAPNTTVKVLAPGAMIYTEYEFLIRSVVFTRSATSEAAQLELVLPGAFDGTIPETLPWDD